MPKVSPLWAALGVIGLISFLLGAAFQFGKLYAENKVIAKEHRALISFVHEQQRIVEGYKPIYESIAASNDETPIGGIIGSVIDDVKRVQKH